MWLTLEWWQHRLLSLLEIFFLLKVFLSLLHAMYTFSVVSLIPGTSRRAGIMKTSQEIWLALSIPAPCPFSLKGLRCLLFSFPWFQTAATPEGAP